MSDFESDDNPYKKAYLRERQARLHSESLLENMSRQMFLKNKELEDSHKKLQQQQASMLNQEKLATIGTLAAGVAHEINNPLAYAASNIEILSNYQVDYRRALDAITELVESGHAINPEDIRRIFSSYDVNYLINDTPELLRSIQEGLNRVKAIVGNLRDFSRTHPSDRVKSSLNAGIESTLKILTSDLKQNQIQLELQFDESLPLIACNPNEINQVILNIVVNAIHAMSDTNDPVLRISTTFDGSDLRIELVDNGRGMSQETLDQIFVPFFTTKPIGKGTGMGMAIAYKIIEAHGGNIDVESELGVGTKFVIRLPQSM